METYKEQFSKYLLGPSFGRLLGALLTMLTTSVEPSKFRSRFYDHAPLAYFISLVLWILFPLMRCYLWITLDKFSPIVQLVISLLYGITITALVSVFYTLGGSELFGLIIFSAFSLLILAGDF